MPSDSANSRSSARKSPTKRTTTSSRPGLGERAQERLRVALAEEGARVRDPEAGRSGGARAPRSRRSRSRSRSSRPARAARAPAPRRRSRRPRRRSRRPARRRGARRRRRSISLSRTSRDSLPRRCGWAVSESRRSATHFAPVAFCTAAPSEVERAGRRGGEDDVDPLAARDPDRRRQRRRAPRHVLVGDEQPAPEQGGLRPEPREPFLAVEPLGGLLALRPDVADAMHPRVRRQRQLGVAGG